MSQRIKPAWIWSRRRSLVTAIGLAVVSSPVWTATTRTGISEEMFFDEIPVVLSATRLHQSLSDSPVAITVIDREMIDASGAIRLVDLFRLIPGMQVGYVSGARFTVSQHGMADRYARRLQVLIDGRSVYDPGYGGVSWFNLPIDMDDIERIEAIRGPNAAAYGSNAFSGVINIITTHPATKPGTRFAATIGEQNTKIATLSHAGTAGNLDYRVTFKHQEDDGFEERFDGSDQNWVNVRGDWQIDNDDALLVQFGMNDGSREEGFPGDPVNFPRENGQQYNYQQVRWSRQYDVGEEYVVHFYHNHLAIDDDFQIPLDSPVPLYAGWGFETDRYDIEFQMTRTLRPDLRVVLGAGARHDQTESVWMFGTRDTIERDQARLFFSSEWHASKQWVGNLGLMAEFTDGLKPLVSPLLGLNYHIDRSNTIRASASIAYRLPSLFEENADQMAYCTYCQPPYDDTLTPFNRWHHSFGNIDPEQIRSIELGYVGSFPAVGLSIEGRLFNERISPTITEIKDPDYPDPSDLWDPSLKPNPFPGTQRVWSDGRVTIRGVELGLKYAPAPHQWFYLGYSRLEADGKQLRTNEGDVKWTHRNLGSYVPENLLSLLGNYQFNNGVNVSAGFYYSDEVKWAGDGDKVPAYRRWDLQLSREFQISGTTLDLALIYRHIDADQIDFYNDPEDYQINRWDEGLFLKTQIRF